MNTFDKQKVTKKIKPKERKHPPKNSPKNSNTKLQAGGLGRVGFSQEGSLWGNNWTALSMHKFIHTHTWIDHHDHPVSGQQAVANAGSRCPLLCCWPLPAACTSASHAVMWAKWKALTHTHTHTRLQRNHFCNETTKKMEKGKINHLPLRMMSTATEKKISNTHTSSTSGIEREKTHKKQQKKIARTQQPKKKNCRRKVVRNGTDREVRTARRHTYDCLAGWLAAWLSPSSRQFFLRQQLTDWATCATWPTDDWAERIYSFFLRLFLQHV